MRVWLDPQKLAARNLTAGDAVAAIREQNVQVAAGQLGAPPRAPAEFQIALNAAGRLTDEQQFRDIIIKTGADGQVVRLGDVARRRAGRAGHGVRSLLDNKPSLAIPVFQSPGANALELSTRVRKTMEELKKNFPEGMDYGILYDPTQFVASRSMRSCTHCWKPCAGRAGGDPLSADLARLTHSADRGSGVRDRSFRCCWRSALHQHPVAVRAGAGHRIG